MDGVGIVVIGRNEGERLVRCLASCHSQAPVIVYVDSGSSDESVDAAARLGATVVKLDTSRPFNAARARNEGFATLTAQNHNVRFVQFVDGDCELDGNWLATAVPFLSGRNDVAVVCGRRRERHPEKSVYNALCDLEWDTPIGEAAVCGGNSLVRADAFEAVGGFDARLIAGEEPELCARLRQAGWKIWRLDAEMTSHDAAMTRFGQWWRRAVRSGYGYAQGAELTSVTGYLAKRDRARAFLGRVLPLAIVAGALMHPIVLTATLAYPIQVARIALQRGATNAEVVGLCTVHHARQVRRGSRGHEAGPGAFAWPHGHSDRVQDTNIGNAAGLFFGAE